MSYWEQYKKWQEGISSSPEIRIKTRDIGKAISAKEEALVMLLELEPLLQRAYARDPLVMAYLDARGLSIEDLEGDVDRLRAIVGDPHRERPITDVDYLLISPVDLLRKVRMASQEELEKILEELEIEQKKVTDLDVLDYLRDVKALVRGRLGYSGKSNPLIITSVVERGIPSREEALARASVLGKEHPRQIYRARYNPEFYDWEIVKVALLHESDDEVIEPLTLRNHTSENIVSLARFIQTEGAIGFSHSKRLWVPRVNISMGIIEPLEYTARLVEIRPYYYVVDKRFYTWFAVHRKALSILMLIEPYLMADKWEEAKYVLSIGKSLPDSMFRPMYIGLVDRTFRPVFLYPEYVDFPIKYAVVVREGDPLPEPRRPRPTIRYTPEGKPIYWHEGMRRLR